MGNRLLLADDSITIQKVVGIIFSTEDYELTIVDNGNAALEKAAEIRPDVMLVDAIMPGKTGYEVCEAVRRDPSLKNTPLLLLTGAFEPFDEDKARQSGADDFIAKPFESQHLIEKVKNLIGLGKERAAAPPVAEAPATFAEEAAATPADLWAEAPAAEPAGFDMFAVEEAAPAETGGEFSFEEVAGGEDVFAAELLAPEEVETATPSDDLWGAFEVEEVKEGEDSGFDTVVELEGGASAAEEPLDAFSFADEEPAPLPEESAFKPGFAEENVPWQPVEEQTFELESAAGEAVSFADVEVEPAAVAPSAVTPPPPAAPASVMEFDVALEEPSVIAAPATASPEPIFVPEEAPVAAPAAVAPAAAPGAMTISEEQLAALVAKISKDIIERIAWEVVPDLAESLIKEEIRKIKEG